MPATKADQKEEKENKLLSQAFLIEVIRTVEKAEQQPDKSIRKIKVERKFQLQVIAVEVDLFDSGKSRFLAVENRKLVWLDADDCEILA